MMTTRGLLGALLAHAMAASAAEPTQMEPDAGSIPPRWAVTGPTPRHEEIELHFMVKQQNVASLHDALMRVSAPSSAAYGMHLTNSEVHQLVAPLPEHLAAVVGFLGEHGATARMETANSDIVSAVVPVGTAEAMLAAKYVTLTHETGEVVQRAPGGYRLPAHVAAAVDLVAPTVHVPGVRRQRPPHSNESARSSGLGFNTPKNLRELYSVGDAVGKAPANKQAVSAFLRQYYSRADLQLWWKRYCGGITCGKGLPKLVGDATSGGFAGVEAMLDIETVTGVAGNVESEFWGFAGHSPDNPSNEPFMKFLARVSGTGDEDVPRLFSTSYGEDEGSWSYAAARRLNTEFMKAGARGISLLFASGDEGANCRGGKFLPEAPGSSPYVTAVGGTAPAPGFPSPGSESAIGLSSGGFSSRWPMPPWQQGAVAAYLGQPGLPPASRGYNVSGRAYPDIAAQATNFCVLPGGCGVAGTSCASPTAAGIFSLLNDLRLQAGKSSLGFLNPLIYQHAEAFNDVTTGSGDGCGFLGGGWPATEGWDAVTGVGTPNYAKLARVVSALPSGRSAGARVVV